MGCRVGIGMRRDGNVNTEQALIALGPRVLARLNRGAKVIIATYPPDPLPPNCYKRLLPRTTASCAARDPNAIVSRICYEAQHFSHIPTGGGTRREANKRAKLVY